LGDTGRLALGWKLVPVTFVLMTGEGKLQKVGDEQLSSIWIS
jgi:hypothetical protein